MEIPSVQVKYICRSFRILCEGALAPPKTAFVLTPPRSAAKHA